MSAHADALRLLAECDDLKVQGYRDALLAGASALRERELGGHRCRACDRHEVDCSNDPCADVIAARLADGERP